MTKLLTILIALSLVSCFGANKKAEIVEQIKKTEFELLKASGNNIELSIQRRSEIDSLNPWKKDLSNPNFDFEHPPVVNLLSHEREDYYRAEAAKNNDLVIYWNSVIDSLNLELKKY